jgi:hypothetical protein
VNRWTTFVSSGDLEERNSKSEPGFEPGRADNSPWPEWDFCRTDTTEKPMKGSAAMDAKTDKPAGLSSGAKFLLAAAAVIGGLYFWSHMDGTNQQVGGGGQANAQNSDIAGVMGALDPVINNLTTRCPGGPNVATAPWSVSAIVTPGVRENPFAGQLVPPGTPTKPTVVGFQQYRLFDSPTVPGHYLWRMTWPQMPVSGADRLNGIDARYQVDLYAVAYRTYDLKTNQWDNWSTKGSFGNEVHFAQFVVEHNNGQWTPRGTVYMQPMGMQLHAVDCSGVPPLE